jgi:flagellar hook-basal body complex protein FliE
VLTGTINQLESLNNNAAESVQKFLSGENEELHTTILATQKASLAFDLGLQVRNKVVDAYQEIMKMQM